MQSHGARRAGDLLRVAVWRLEAGAGGDGALLARAAERAMNAPDAVLAERLARAAVRAGGGLRRTPDARPSARRGGRAEEAQDLFDALGAEAREDGDRAAVAIGSVGNLFWSLGRPRGRRGRPR